jgi:hypothetical protein
MNTQVVLITGALTGQTSAGSSRRFGNTRFFKNAEILDHDVTVGSSASVYAFRELSVHRNLYKIDTP